jgi:proteasome lid subunit RPN8/RPN11
MEQRDEKTYYSGAKVQSLAAELTFTKHAWDKLMAYCRATDLEVSGFMIIERDENQLFVNDIYICEQISTPTSTEMEGTAMSKLFLRLHKEGILNDKTRVGHFHTHPTFGVFWSGTDMEMRKTLRRGCDWYVSVVVNQKGEALAALDINGEFPMEISDLPISFLPDNTLSLACKEEVKTLVKAPRFSQEVMFPEAGRYGQERWRGVTPIDKIIQHLEQGEELVPLMESEKKDRLEKILSVEGDTCEDEGGRYINVGGEIVRVISRNVRLSEELF